MVSYVFQRYELKYLLSGAQAEAILREVTARLSPDAYGETTVQSLYYDTADDRIIRASLEKPIYKEKLRLRSYGLCPAGGTVFLEMKRKCGDVVYKRRLALSENEVADVLEGRVPDSQIGREIAYFLSFYPDLRAKVLILSDRSAWLDPGSDLRVTFDRNIRFRTDALDCRAALTGESLLPPGCVVMECKSGLSFPLWLTHLLCAENARKTSFSKYGAAYEKLHRAASLEKKQNKGDCYV